MISLAGIALKSERFAALPSVAGPQVRMRPTKAPNSGFTLRSSLSLVAWPSATRSVVTAVAEKQRRNRLCPPRRFVNPPPLGGHAGFGGDCSMRIGV